MYEMRGMVGLVLRCLLAIFLLLRFALSCEGSIEDLSQRRPAISSWWIVLPGLFGSSADFQSIGQGEEDHRNAGDAKSSGARLSLEAGLHNESKEAVSCPASCFRPNPVCGVNGVTYWCGAADADCAGVEVDYVGFCDIGSRGTGGKGVLAVQSLLLVHTIWLMLAGFLVLLGIP